MTLIAIVILSAVLGGVVQWYLGEQDRRVQGRASARVILDVLTSATCRNYGPKQQPFALISIDYAGYVAAWGSERKALARVMMADEFAVIAKAFDELRTIGKMESQGKDLSEIVYDVMMDATHACEKARRILCPYSYSWRDERLRQKKIRSQINAW